MTVKIFHDYHAFLARVEGMSNIAAVQKPDRRHDKRVRILFGNLHVEEDQTDHN